MCLHYFLSCFPCFPSFIHVSVTVFHTHMTFRLFYRARLALPLCNIWQHGYLLWWKHETCEYEACGHETCGHETWGHETCGHDTCGHERRGPWMSNSTTPRFMQSWLRLITLLTHFFHYPLWRTLKTSELWGLWKNAITSKETLRATYHYVGKYIYRHLSHYDTSALIWLNH